MCVGGAGRGQRAGWAGGGWGSHVQQSHPHGAQWVTAAGRMPIVIEMRFFTELGLGLGGGLGAKGCGAVRGSQKERDSSRVAASAVAHRGRPPPMSDG